MRDTTLKKRWGQLLPASPQPFPLLAYHRYPERSQARQQVMALSVQGWHTRSSSRFLRGSRPTSTQWIARFERDTFAGLADQSRAPKAPGRKVWLPVMLEGYHRQKRHPDAGRFRIWSGRGNTEIAARTVGRVMALNKRVSDDIPHGRRKTTPKDPPPHPYAAQTPPEYWFIAGRMMDCKIDGVKWWSLIVLDGSSRAMLAGAGAPAEASGVALLVLYTACVRYGAPQHLLSDKGGASISAEFAAVCERLGIAHKKIPSTEGESSLNWMETHCNVQRRLYDCQFS